MSKSKPNRGTSAPKDYIETFLHNFPTLPAGAITDAWKHHETPSEYRAHLERTHAQKEPR